ncbi:hypothetical protein MKW98_026979 [Papaver atlanticum]|uniref:adenosylmethionine decarboxylase n=1 Tax=Papaver atlanticum TaxID=357466 RepID=A0AAD4SVG2_9MAGN|nr:hypothetical protein MKW98_026979 [Papaver atlanticum]
MASPISAIRFEGFEKRLEISFFELGVFADPAGNGLRALTKSQLDEILKPAECTIVGSISNAHLDSYILSESSFFVYPYKMIIKTCGTTKLLLSIPPVLELAKTPFLTVRAVRNVSEEVIALDSQFIKLGLRSRAYVMGDNKSQNWHVYSAFAEATGNQTNPSFTLEMCMTGLNKECASVFYKTESSTANEMTEASGIRKIFPDSNISDFEFDRFSTIHVTPEDGFSCASFEAVGYDLKNAVDLKQLLRRVLSCFEPNEFSVAVHSDIGNSVPELRMGSLLLCTLILVIMSQSFVNVGSCRSPRSILKSCWKSEDEEDSH